MPTPRSYTDRPLRRIAVSVVLAAAAHVVVFAVAWYLLKDYVLAAGTSGRIDRAKVEQVINDSPIAEPAFSLFPGSDDGDAGIEVMPRSEGWEQVRAMALSSADLPFLTEGVTQRRLLSWSMVPVPAGSPYTRPSN